MCCGPAATLLGLPAFTPGGLSHDKPDQDRHWLVREEEMEPPCPQLCPRKARRQGLSSLEKLVLEGSHLRVKGLVW